MEYILAVFSVRTDTMQFNRILNKNGISSTVVETPKSASASCGISVKFALKDLNEARRLLTFSGTKSFVRFYLVTGFYGNAKLTPIK